MCADGLVKIGSVCLKAGDVITILCSTAVPNYAFGGDFDNTIYPFPIFLFVNPVKFMYDLAGSDLRPPVPFIQMLAVTVFPEVKLVGYLVIKRFMVLLQGQI